MTDTLLDTQLIDTAIQQAKQMISDSIPQHKILAHLVTTAEQLAGGNAVSSILLLDEDGLLRNGSSPRLPYDYLTAIDGLKPDPDLGTCAAAAARGTMIITVDFRADDKWAELRHLPLALGFIGAWSMPIKNNEGKVLGTFGTYYREQREPSQSEISGMRQLAAIAAKVVKAPLV